MQELLLGSLGTQLVGFVTRNPWPAFAGVLVAALLILQLIKRGGDSSTGGDFEFGGSGFGCDGDGGGDGGGGGD